jgi:transcriptional regulator with XRE-family HTH domain
MSQEDLALACGMTVRFLDALERREKPRFAIRLRAMSHVLKVPVVELQP